MLKELPTPFIVQFKHENNSYFTVVKNITESQLDIVEVQSGKWKTITKEIFAKSWTGTVTLVSAQVNAGEESYNENRKKEFLHKLLPITSVTLILFMMFFTAASSIVNNGWSSWYPISLLILKFLGSYIGGLLLWYEIDTGNAALQKVCKSGKNANCNAVLQSKYSKVFGVISWSELGFTYFFGGLIFLLNTVLNPIMVTILAWLNIFTLPYIIFSIYYQGKIIKQWCLLCLTIQAILFLEAVLSISTGWLFTNLLVNISVNQMVTFVLCFGLPLLCWFLIKPVIMRSKESTKNKKELIRLRHNPKIFEALLAKEKQIAEDATGLGLILGNPNAKNKIIKVCNPYCGPCAKAHPDVDYLLENNTDLQVQILFKALDHETDKTAAPVKHFLAIADKNEITTLKKALDDWYYAPVKDYKVFAGKYPLNEELTQQGHKLNSMREWCKKTGITYTPTFFINGYQLPEMYSIADIKYFLNLE